MADKTQTFNRDCLEAMREFPDKFFELAIVDPPYGLGEGQNKVNTRSISTAKWKNAVAPQYGGGVWDNEPMSLEYFIELQRITKHQIIWGANHFIENIPNANSSSWAVWYKVGQNDKVDFAACELAWTSHKKAVDFFRFDWTGFGAVNAKEERIHPTQKPVALYKWLLKNYAKEGDKILDSHCGSQSSRIAAFDMGFAYWGYELDKDYFEAGNKRFNQHKAQLKLF